MVLFDNIQLAKALLLGECRRVERDPVRTCITKRNGHWTVRFDITNTPDGKRRQRRITLKSGTRHDAEVLAAQVVRDMDTDSYAHCGRMLVSELLNEWLNAKKSGWARKTYDRYHSITQHHLIPRLGGIQLAKLRKKDVIHALEYWSTGPRCDERGGVLSSTSVNHIFRALSTALHFACKSGYIARNPCLHVDPPPRAEGEVEPISLQDLCTLLKATKDEVLRDAVLTKMGTGLRASELVGLSWGNVNLPRGLLNVKVAYVTSNGVNEIKQPKSKRSIRTVVLPEFVVKTLAIVYERQAVRFEALGLPPPASDTPVFDRLGERWSSSNFSSAFYRLVRKAEIPKCRLHDVRHSFASYLADAGMDLKVISDILGHSGLRITADRYVHIQLSLKREAAARLHQRISAYVECHSDNHDTIASDVNSERTRDSTSVVPVVVLGA